MAGFSLRLPEELESRLDEEARREGRARSEVARTAIAEFLERRERERYMAAFVAAEQAVPLDNEGLRVAERRGSYPDGPPRRQRGTRR